MNRHNFLSFFLALFLFSPFSLMALDSAIYEAEVTVPVYENDVVSAQKTADLQLRKQIVLKAIRVLLGDKLYERNRKLLERRRFFNSSDYLLSVKDLGRSLKSGQFKVKLSGRVDLKSLIHFLKKSGYALTTDPWHKITLVRTYIPETFLKQFNYRFSSLKLKISDTPLLIEDLEIFKNPDHSKITQLFEKYPENPVIFYLRAENNEAGLMKAIHLSVFRRVDNTKLVELVQKLKRPLNLEKIKLLDDNSNIDTVSKLKDLLQKETDSFIRRLTYANLKINRYESKLKENATLEILGLKDSAERSIFVKQILSNIPGMLDYKLTVISSSRTVYEIRTRGDISELARNFERELPGVNSSLLSNEGNKIQIKVTLDRNQQRRVTNLIEWDPQLNKPTQKKISRAFKEVELIPDFQELEPNNNTWEVNELLNDKTVYGKISSRSDEDLYQFEIPEGTESINIFWLRVGKTNLLPKLKIYDSELNQLGSYRIYSSRSRLQTTLKFEKPILKRIFIRVSDLVGAIKGDSGGYRRFAYLLKIAVND